MITYRAKSLEDIAQLFQQFSDSAAVSAKAAALKKDEARWIGESIAWQEAARMLRSTKLEGVQSIAQEIDRPGLDDLDVGKQHKRITGLDPT